MRYELISVTRNELNITESFFPTKKDAINAMVEDMKTSCGFKSIEEIIDAANSGTAGFSDDEAWAETCDQGTGQWKIVELPLQKSQYVSMTVFKDSTGLYAEEECDEDNLTCLDFPVYLVEEYVKAVKPELTYNEFLDQYCADWTEGFVNFAKAHGYTLSKDRCTVNICDTPQTKYIYKKFCDGDAYGEEHLGLYDCKEDAMDALRADVEKWFKCPWGEIKDGPGQDEFDEEGNGTFEPDYVCFETGDGYQFFIVEELPEHKSTIKVKGEK